MKSALKGISAVATSANWAGQGYSGQVATGFQPYRAFRVSRPPEDKDAAVVSGDWMIFTVLRFMLFVFFPSKESLL